MKLKHLIIVSLILAIFTIGVVSATENVDNLTEVPDAVDTVSQIDENEVIADDSEDVIGEVPGETIGASVPNYNLYVPEKVRLGSLSDFCIEQYAQIGFNEDNLDGDVSFYIDDDFKYSETVYSWGSAYFYLDNLDLDAGLHNLTVRFTSNDEDTFSSFEDSQLFETYYFDVDVPEKIIMNPDWYDDLFYVHFASDAGGYFDLIFDGKEVDTVSITDHIMEDYSLSYVVYVQNYLDSFGEHSYTVRYHDGKYEDIEKSGSFIFDYNFDVECNDELAYGHPANFIITVPEGVTTINLTANRKNYTIEINDDGVYSFNELVYGVNDFVFTCGDSKVPKKTVELSFDVSGKIVFPDEDIIYNSDKNIVLILPDDADGDLTLIENDEVIETVKLENGQAYISISNFDVGYHYLSARYTGEDYEVSDVDVDLKIYPEVIYPTGIWTESDEEHYITVIMPEESSHYLQIDIYYYYHDYWDDEDTFEWIEQIYYSDNAQGTISCDLPDLMSGNYAFKVSCNGLEKFYLFKVKDNNPNLVIDVDIPSKMARYDYDYDGFFFRGCIPGDCTGILDLYIDDVMVRSGRCDDFEYDCYYSLSRLDVGVHTWKLVLHDDPYYNDCSAEGAYEICWVVLPEEIALNNSIWVEFHDGETGYVTLLIDGKEYDTDFIYYGFASFSLNDDLAFGEHTYELIYSGDESHSSLTASGSFNLVTFMEVTGFDKYSYSESYPVNVVLPEDATGTVTLTVIDEDTLDEITYSGNVADGYVQFNVEGLTAGSYSYAVEYSGDSKYASYKYSDNFIIRYKVIYNDDDIDENPFEFVSLCLPSDANGNLTVYDDDGNMIKTVKLENGKATVYLTDFELDEFGFFDFHAEYESENDDYSVEGLGFWTNYGPDIPYQEFSFGQDAKIEFDTLGETGSITLYINGEEFQTNEIENGKIIFNIPSDNLKLGDNVVSFSSDNEKLNNFFSYDWGDFKEYYIYVNLNITAPHSVLPGEPIDISFELPEDLSGTVDIYADEDLVLNTPVSGGKVTIPLTASFDAGYYYTIYLYFNGDGFSVASNYVKVLVKKSEATVNITVPTGSGSTPEFTVNLPSDATGSLIVTVDGKTYIKDLVDGKATVVIPDLADGDYNVTIKYSGDKNYGSFTKDTSISINTSSSDDSTYVTPKIVAKDLSMVYSDGSKYSVTVYGTDGKLASGVTVTFKIGSKVIGTAKTNANGVASIKITQIPKTYKITSEALGVSVTKKLTVKHILALKKVNVKRSAKKLVLTATLKKVNGKYLKGKKITFKFKGKKYVVKTNKKGVAKVTIKKNVLKKLKKGKKVTYQATYLKDTVKRTAKVKK